MTRSGPRVQVEEVHGGYGRPSRGVHVLHGLDLTLEPGTATAVVGANGAGKTTLIRTLLGTLRPWSGRVILNGLSPDAYRRTRGVAHVAEEVALPPGWTVIELVAEGARLRGLRGARRVARIRRSMSTLALEDVARVPVQKLSRGAARRTAMAFALVGRATGLVLLDEPLSGLDPRARARARALVSDLRRRGATVLITTHELREVGGLADAAVVLDRGRIAARLSGSALERLEDVVLGQEPGSS